MYDGSTPHQSAVITRAGVFFGNGQLHRWTGDDAPALRMFRQLPRLLHGADRMAERSTVIIDGLMPADIQGEDEARNAGWRWSDLGPWTFFYRDNGRQVAVGFRDAMQPRHLDTLFDRDTEPGILAMRLDRYHKITGAAWRGTFATTAMAAIRASWENSGHNPLWRHDTVTGAGHAGPLYWSRELTDREQSWGWVHQLDATAAYLGSMIGAELSWSGIDHTGPVAFDGRRPGYWRIKLGPMVRAWMADPMRPPLVNPAKIRDGQAWVMTPMAQLLADIELGDPDVTDSHLGGRSNRWLRKWAEQLRDARTPAARYNLGPAVRRSYKDAIGGMQRPTMRIHRADVAHTVIDLWRATLLRRVIRVQREQGVWPVMVKVDELHYADGGPLSPRGLTHPFPTLADSLNVWNGQGEVAPLGSYVHDTTLTAQEWAAKQAPERDRVAVPV